LGGYPRVRQLALYQQLRRPLSRFNTFTALLMTLLMTCAVVVPVLWILMLVQSEFLNAYRALTSYLARGPQALPAAIRDIPWLGNLLQEQLNRYSSDPAALAHEATGWMQRSALALGGVLGDIGRNFLKILFAVLTCAERAPGRARSGHTTSAVKLRAVQLGGHRRKRTRRQRSKRQQHVHIRRNRRDRPVILST
jgi:hypothetical protein